MNQKRMFVAVGVFLLLALGGGVLVWQKKQIVPQPKQITQTVEQPIQTDEVESVKDLVDGEYAFTPIDTSDWQTYRNEDAGFEVKVPKDWVLVKRIPSEFDGSVMQLVSPEVQKAIKTKKVDYFCDWSISYYSNISDEPENKFGGLGAATLAEMISKNHTITLIGKTMLGGERAADVVWGGYGAYYTILSDHSSHLYKLSSCNKESRGALTTIDMTILTSFRFLK